VALTKLQGLSDLKREAGGEVHEVVFKYMNVGENAKV